MNPQPTGVGRQGIEDYYGQTWLDYRLLWMDRTNLALHFGYHDPSSRRHSQALSNTNRVLARIARINGDSVVLDAGCGVGGSALWLARHVGAKVVGLTVARRQAIQANGFLQTSGTGKTATFVQGDYTEMPFRSASSDVVWALESVCHAEQKFAFYREAARVLRPGGRLVVAEYMRSRRPLRRDEETLVREWLTGWLIPDLDTPSEHTRHAAEAGFIDVNLEDFASQILPSVRRLHRIACLTYPLARIARFAEIRTPLQHGNVIAAIRQYQLFRRGCWAYMILEARKPE